MILIYNIDLIHYKSILQRNYLNFTKSELGESLLLGTVIICNKNKDFFVFEADLLKFSYDLYDSLIELDNSKNSNSTLNNIYQFYEFELKKMDTNLVMTLNKKSFITFNFEEFLKEIRKLKKRLLEDVKILYPNYKEIKNVGFLIESLTR